MALGSVVASNQFCDNPAHETLVKCDSLLRLGL